MAARKRLRGALKAGKRESKTKTKKVFLFVREHVSTHQGRLVKKYFGCTREGTAEKMFRDEVLVKITKAQYEAHLTRIAFAERGQAHGRRLKHNGEVVAVKGAGHCWPMKCDAMAVHPSQVEEMNAHNKRHGVNVQYDPKWGTAIIPTAGEYKKFRRLYGVHQRNSYND